MKRFLLLTALFVAIYSCSDETNNMTSDISDIAILDSVAYKDATDIITGSDSSSEDVTDVTTDLSAIDTGDVIELNDTADVFLDDSIVLDVSDGDSDDILVVDAVNDISEDSFSQDVLLDEGNFDAGMDDGYSDASYDAGDIDFGTQRGLLFSAIEKFKSKPSIFYVDPQGGVPTRISPDISDEFKRPFWSPDGNSYYFESSGKIYKTPFGKFEPIEVCVGMDFAVSPDERYIALNKYVKLNEQGEYDYELFLYDMMSKTYTQITTFMDGEMENRPSSPSFSPDSKRILFSILNPTGSYDVYSSDLFIYEIETGFLINITNEAKKIQAKVANRSPEWSSDLNRYAYMHILYPESGYYLVDGLNPPRRVSEETHNGIDGIAFSPNANAMAIVTNLGKGISIIDLSGRVLFEIPVVDLTYIDNLSWR